MVRQCTMYVLDTRTYSLSHLQYLVQFELNGILSHHTDISEGIEPHALARAVFQDKCSPGSSPRSRCSVRRARRSRPW
jgi:hypothetical protein